jgi:hypothetical protein
MRSAGFSLQKFPNTPLGNFYRRAFLAFCRLKPALLQSPLVFVIGLP